MIRNQLQHYLPEVYLKGFMDDPRGEVWRYDRKDGSLKSLPPAIIAAEINLYSIERDGVVFQEIENPWFSGLDGCFGPIRRKIEEREMLSPRETRHLASFMAYLRVRTPACIREVESMLRQWENRLGDLDAVQKWDTEDYPGHREPDTYASTTEWMDEVSQKRAASSTRNHVMKMVVQNGLHLSRALMDLNWCLLSPSDDRSFVVGDNPFVVVPPASHVENEQGVGPMTPGASVFIPVSSKLCMRLSGEPAKPRHRIDGSAVRGINAVQVLNSERFIYGPSEALMLKLTSEFVKTPGLNPAVVVMREADSTSRSHVSLLHTFTKTKIAAEWASRLPLD